MSLTVIESPSPPLPKINERAPDFEAMSTHGPIKLTDYHGRWLLFFSHPADFTPVCTTEFISFAKNFETFQALSCDLLALSIDSRFSHLAWVENIRTHFDVEIPFPVVEDISLAIASLYGMIHPRSSNVSTVRSTFLIDPKGIIKSIVYYPQNVGRSVSELIRLVQAVQTADDYQVSTPEGWRPGEKVMVTPPSTVEDLKNQQKDGLECRDWYFCTQPLGKNSGKKTA
ncbi:MAG TPA: peroxiredoxin [Bdellovibrionales bacterium]|nr:MAG: peroxiredoxin [Bdellovibrionales bacterium GWB1_52_6]OFZ05822.1 MAG: peroxiredoxin [Bdellovibrionales bacterium GWA1_52_35]OFZ39331.1 MAG: peroxiredoxin [Bdellovibrionales bacterium GWC1_52_8]HAR42696.1 peroxiredoxin [Bdellovibrionales bacterium]HCM40233.1 peroxiredoxin [Bdellovibrionales bacterium]